MFLKKMYVTIAVLSLAFLYFNCGGNEDSGQAQQEISALKGNSAEGQKYFAQTCSACHGMDAKGLPKLGKDLTTSAFLASETDAELLGFLKQGRLSTDPLNTTGVSMPPKGGNPAYNDQQLSDIISYLRQIHQ